MGDTQVIIQSMAGDREDSIGFLDEKEKITILVPIKNGVEFVKKKIEELANLNYPNYEVLISVNLSTDGTFALVNQYTLGNPTFRVYSQTEELTIAQNFSFLLEQAKTSLVIFSAIDDSLSSNFLQEAMKCWREQPQAIAVVGAARFEGNTHGNSPIYLNLTQKKTSKRLLEFIRKSRVSHALFYCLSRKVIFQEFSERYSEEFIGRDWIFGIELCLAGKIAISKQSEILFGVKGTSRQRRYLYESDEKKYSMLFPYFKLSKHLRVIARTAEFPSNIILYSFSIWLLWSNIKRSLYARFLEKNNYEISRL